jgi:hypothetical protein
MKDILTGFVDVFNELIEIKKTNWYTHSKPDEKSEIYYQKIALINNSTHYSMPLLLQLIEKYDIAKSVNLAFIRFYPEPLQNDIQENWIAFGEYPGYDLLYVLDTTTKEIVCVFLETNTVEWYCAKNEESFLINCIEIIKIKTLYAKRQNVSDALLAITYDNCIEVAGGEKYKTYYNYALGYGL